MCEAQAFAGVRACLLPPLLAIRHPAEPPEREEDVPFVPDPRGDLGCLGVHGGSLVCIPIQQRHLGDVDQHESDPREIADLAA